MDLYVAKRALLRPYLALMRAMGRKTGSADLQAFEVHNYGPAFVKFALRYLRNPAILHSATVPDVSVIFDVGAFDGAWSVAVHARYSNAKIYAFEPDPSALRRARPALAPIEKVKLFPYGLAAVGGAVDLLPYGPGSTAFPAALERLDPSAEARSTIKVLMRDARAVIKELGVERIDLMKINIEGGEFDLLERLIATGCIARCRCLLIQFHEWFPDAYGRRRRIHAALRRTHTLDWSDYFVWESWTRRGEPRVGT